MKIRIHGIKDGKHEIALTDDVSNFPDIFPEFYGEVTLVGTLAKTRNRYTFNGTAKCNANLICDLSLDEYSEEIVADVDVSFIVSTELYFLQQNSNNHVAEETAIHEDEPFFDITTDVKDALVVSLPMKRIAPQHRGKTFNDFHQNNDDQRIDKRWEALRNIDFDDL
jgi:uncharacterized metal-binding protein YceD (DUF177 family)